MVIYSSLPLCIPENGSLRYTTTTERCLPVVNDINSDFFEWGFIEGIYGDFTAPELAARINLNELCDVTSNP